MTIWGRMMTALSTGWRSGVDAWKHGPIPLEWDQQQWEYGIRWSLYTGQIFEGFQNLPQVAGNPAIYRNTKLLWKHHEAIVDFYAGVVYQGALSTDGKPLPDDMPNAIPFQAQTGNDERNEQLTLAYSELFNAWNWRQQMSLRPMYGAALGDVLTELIDDTERRFVYPQIVWPGYVKDIEIDYVGNVRRYVLEYRVEERNQDGTPGDTYLYRKEVDKEMFRHYRNDKMEREYENVYGFVPAIWDRHRIGSPNTVRGKAAADGTRQALLQLNSLFGHALDFQHKAFWIPLMVAGRHQAAPGSGNKTIDLSTAPTDTSLAEIWRWVKVPEGSQLLQPNFDVGKTTEMIKDIREGILAENPEASYFEKLRDMQIVSAPGAKQLMGDVELRVDLARRGYDANTVKLFQMAISMCGFRATDQSGDGWTRDNNRLDRRRMAFVPFDLTSYDRGEMDLVIDAPRPIIYPTEMERMETERIKLELIAAKEGIFTDWGLEEAGLDEDAIKAIKASEAWQANAAGRAFNRGATIPGLSEGE